MQTIDFAIQMEEDAARYYREQAERFKGQPIARAFDILVSAEEKHRALLQAYQEKKPENNAWTDLTANDDIYSQLPDFKNDVASIPRQMDVYRKAMDLEQKSIELYQGLLDQATDPAARRLLAFLIHEEKKHLSLFDELFTLVRHADDWVEDAEFGTREPY